MGLSAAQAKGRIKNIASKSGADPRVLMRIYMMERFLERVSVSSYKDNFIIKGGMLITSMVGISMRSTMDIDTTVKGQDLSVENAKRIVKSKCLSEYVPDTRATSLIANKLRLFIIYGNIVGDEMGDKPFCPPFKLGKIKEKRYIYETWNRWTS